MTGFLLDAGSRYWREPPRTPHTHAPLRRCTVQAIERCLLHAVSVYAGAARADEGASSSQDITIIIGSVIGGSIGLMLIITVVCILLWRRRKAKQLEYVPYQSPRPQPQGGASPRTLPKPRSLWRLQSNTVVPDNVMHPQLPQKPLPPQTPPSKPLLRNPLAPAPVSSMVISPHAAPPGYIDMPLGWASLYSNPLAHGDGIVSRRLQAPPSPGSHHALRTSPGQPNRHTQVSV